MEQVWELLPLILAMAVTGAVAGVLAGLLGVGGGLVIVPVLEAALASHGVDPAVRMHIAVGTSLATIIPTSLSSSRAHYRKGGVDFGLVKLWGPFIIAGSALGTVLAAQLDSSLLSQVFGVVALLLAIKMMLPLDDLRLADDVPRGVWTPWLPAGIGGLSSMMGIGGGNLSVPSLTLCGRAIHTAVGTSALFGLFIALPGTIGYVINGWNDPRLPAASFGYVSILGFLLISPMTVLFAPLGAQLAHRLSRQHLNLVFGTFLLIVSARMLLRALGPGSGP